MPPPSPEPGRASGDVCRERTASERTAVDKPNELGQVSRTRLRPGGRCLFALDGRWRLRRLVGRVAELGALQALVLVLERDVHLDERLLLGLGDRGIAQDLTDEVVVAFALLEDAGTHVQRLGRDAQRL